MAERPETFVGSTIGSTSALFYRQDTLVLKDSTRLRGVSFGYDVRGRARIHDRILVNHATQRPTHSLCQHSTSSYHQHQCSSGVQLPRASMSVHPSQHGRVTCLIRPAVTTRHGHTACGDLSYSRSAVVGVRYAIGGVRGAGLVPRVVRSKKQATVRSAGPEHCVGFAPPAGHEPAMASAIGWG